MKPVSGDRSAAVVPPIPGNPGPPAGGYVRESSFGEWFQRTDIWRHYVVEQAVTELVSLLPARRGPFNSILDVGCGEGAAFEILQRTLEPETLIGVDIHPDAVLAAGGAARRLESGVQVRLADAADLPFESGSIDLVLCHQLLHHSSDPVRVLREIHRVLVPRGWLLFAESCRQFLDWWPVRLLFRHPPREQHTALEYVGQLDDTGFLVDPASVLTPTPWWSRWDFCIGQKLFGLPGSAEATQVRIAARKS